MPPDLDTPSIDSNDAKTARATDFFDALKGLSIRATKGEGTARATLARLRRQLDRRGVDPLAFREVGMYLNDVPPEEHDLYLLAAALFAQHAAKTDQPWFIRDQASLGASCRQARRDGSVSIDLRFAALLDARREDLPYRLRQIIALLAAGGIGVRYDRLIRDLQHWDDPSRCVQRAWSSDYWTSTTSTDSCPPSR